MTMRLLMMLIEKKQSRWADAENLHLNKLYRGARLICHSGGITGIFSKFGDVREHQYIKWRMLSAMPTYS